MLAEIQSGRLPKGLSNLLSPFAIDAHAAHIQSLDRLAHYQVCGLEIEAAPGLYHPHATSSSHFTLRTLLRENRSLGHLLELGCGTGVLSLALLHQSLAEQAVMVDISAEAIRTSASNARKAGLEQRTRILQGDLFEPVGGETFDTVLFNLPLMHTAHHGSTHQALDDTAGGLAERFFQDLPRYLKPGGAAYFSYSNICDESLLADFSHRHPVELVAAEWVVSSGFWLMVYRADAPTMTTRPG